MLSIDVVEEASAAGELHGPVLVAVDFSPSSSAALDWACEVAAALGAPLRVLHVVHDPGSAPGYYSQAKKRKKHLHRLEEAAAEMLEEFVGEARKRHPKMRVLRDAGTDLVVGLPVTRILEVAEKVDARLIVVGSQGRTGLPHLLLGSKAERVAQYAPMPVTIVKAPGGKKKK